MRTRDSDAICGLCDEFDIDRAAPELVECGFARCLMRDECGSLASHVVWSEGACVSFRLDRPNLRRRRQFVEACRHFVTDKEPDPSQGGTESPYETQ